MKKKFFIEIKIFKENYLLFLGCSYLENTVWDKRYPAIAAAVKAKPFLNKGIISFVLEIIGAIPKMPNNMPHRGERRAKKPIDII